MSGNATISQSRDRIKQEWAKRETCKLEHCKTLEFGTVTIVTYNYQMKRSKNATIDIYREWNFWAKTQQVNRCLTDKGKKESATFTDCANSTHSCASWRKASACPNLTGPTLSARTVFHRATSSRCWTETCNWSSKHLCVSQLPFALQNVTQFP